MSVSTSFGQWLKQRRKALDISQDALAAKIQCSVSILYKIEADTRRASKQIAELLAEHLNIPPDERTAFIQFARGTSIDSAAPWGTAFHTVTNLPAPPTLLIGRDSEVNHLAKRLLHPDARLLTLIGPPGIGKTRLALAVAALVADDFADGVFFVAFAPISDANLVSTIIASTLGIPARGPRTPFEQVKAFLHDKETLLVLDNFEQVVSAASQIADLLTTCPQVKLLVTSRAPLRIRQERQIPVSPLALPNPNQLLDVLNLTHYAAITLFVERAQSVKSDFALTLENAAAVASICIRLDGLPLAIELISARVKLLPPAVLLERLDGRLMLQSDGMHDLEPRHRTLNSAIDWSYQLLSQDEQTLFRRMGVFVGGWTLEAAESLSSGNVNVNTLDGLASLLDKSLIKRDGDSRFTMLETIREYALERLAAGGELDDLRGLHADYFTALAERTEVAYFRSDPTRWRTILDAELGNFRAALRWNKTALRLAVALHQYWMRRGYLSEGSQWIAGALSQHEHEIAGRTVVTDADHALWASANYWLGRFSAWQGDTDAALPRYEASLQRFRELGDNAGIASNLGDLTTLFNWRSDYPRAEGLVQECLTLFRSMGNKGGTAWALSLYGMVSIGIGQVQRAGAYFEESLSLFQEVNDPWGIAGMYFYLAMVAVDEKDYRGAHDHLINSLTHLYELGDRWLIIQTIEYFARLKALQSQPFEGVQPALLVSVHLYGAAESLRKTFLSEVTHWHDGIIADLRTHLGDDQFAASWANGQAMTLEKVVAYALLPTSG